MTKQLKKLPANLPRQSMGDILDKLTTLARKVYFGEEDAIEEMNYLIECLDTLDLRKHTPRLGKFIITLVRLAQINFEIWNLENQFRRGLDLSDRKVKEIALAVREQNRKRVHYKNEINKLTKLGFRECKIKHLSQ